VSILIDKHTRLIVQGITGRDGGFHAQQMIAYGTHVVAGVTPGRGGEKAHGVPVFDSVAGAVAATRANASVIYVPAAAAADAIFEAADAGVGLIVCISEGIPVRDTMAAYHHVATLRAANGNGRPRLLGPNCPGLISPGQSKVGILPGQICTPGPVGLVSRSGTLTYEVVHQLTQAGLGQTTCIGIGGDPIIGTSFIDTLELFEADPHTEAIVLIGEIGGTDEEEAAQFIKRRVRKPVVAFIAGQTAPPGKRMGHAGAIITGGSGTAAEKMVAFQAAGVPVARIPSEIPALIAEALTRRRPRARPAFGGAGRANARRAASGSARTAVRRSNRGRPAVHGAIAPKASSGNRNPASVPKRSGRKRSGRKASARDGGRGRSRAR